MSNMNAMIIGMTEAGKTVFISQFFWYLRKQYGPTAITGDYETEEYVAEIRGILAGENGDSYWPISTPMGTIKQLHFNLNIGDLTGCLDMVDAAGQDMQSILKKGDFSKLTDKEKEFIKKMNDAHEFIYLFDLMSIGSHTSTIQNMQDSWCFRQFIEFCNAKERPALILLSKADEFAQLEEEDYSSGNAVYNLIKHELKKKDSLNSWDIPAPSDRFIYRAVASVVTETHIKKGIPCKKPIYPLRSIGMENIL